MTPDIIIGTRAIGKKAGMDYDRDLGGLIDGCKKVGAIAHLATQTEYQDLLGMTEWTQNKDITMSMSRTRDNQSPADMVNLVATEALNRGIGLWGIISADFVPHMVDGYKRMMDRLVGIPNLAMVGVAMVGVHNVHLLSKIREGREVLSHENLSMVFPNNAMSASRTMVAGVPHNLRLFPRESDNGRLGEGVGGNEEMALMLLSIKLGIPLRYTLLSDRLISRDRKMELEISQTSQESVPDKVLRRPAVQRAYQEEFGVTNEALDEYIRGYYQIVFD